MRFAWQRKKLAEESNVKAKAPNPLIYLSFNAIWWIPIILTFVGVIDYHAGFVSFSLITLVRLIANVSRNNLLSLERAESFPFRS